MIVRQTETLATRALISIEDTARGLDREREPTIFCEMRSCIYRFSKDNKRTFALTKKPVYPLDQRVFAALLHLFISHDGERVDESTVIGETLEVEFENAYSLHRSMSCCSRVLASSGISSGSMASAIFL